MHLCDIVVIQFLLGLLFLVVLAAIWLGIGALRRWLFRRRVDKATQTFEGCRNSLQQMFLNAASATGKPRGLIWKECDLHDGQLFAHDRVANEIYALAGVTICFEAVVGGEMEEVEAVGNLRCATAVFAHRDGTWTTDGRVLFNLEPHEALQRYSESLQPISSQEFPKHPQQDSSSTDES